MNFQDPIRMTNYNNPLLVREVDQLDEKVYGNRRNDINDEIHRVQAHLEDDVYARMDAFIIFNGREHLQDDVHSVNDVHDNCG